MAYHCLVGIPRVPGVYVIRNVVDGKGYVGSSCQRGGMHARLQHHIRRLRCGAHRNGYLQSAWTKYGSGSFIFEVLEEVHELAQLAGTEAKWIKELNTCDRRFGYNLTEITEDQRFVMSEEARQKMAKAKIGNRNALGHKLSMEQKEKLAELSGSRRHSPESRRKMSEALTGNQRACGYKHSSDAKCRMTEARSKMWIVVTPYGQEMVVSNLKQFCRDRGLQPSGMYQVAAGLQQNHNGWSCRRLEPEVEGRKVAAQTRAKMAESHSKSWIVITPDGQEAMIKNLDRFCKENSLSTSRMFSVAAGKQRQHRGWKCVRLD